MKKKLINLVALTLVLNATTTIAQESYNRFSIDLGGGITKPYRQQGLATGIYYPNINLGLRYMSNTKFGFKIGGQYNQFKSASGVSVAKEFDSRLMAFNVEGVINMGRALQFEEWAKRFTILVHAGPGYTLLNSNIDKSIKDQALNLNMGITGMIRLSDRISINADMSNMIHIMQSKALDAKSPITSSGFDGGFMSFSVGVSVYLGKSKTHADWHVPVNPLKRQLDSLALVVKANEEKVDSLSGKLTGVEEKINTLETSLETIQKDLQDDDKDGVANKFDLEPNSKEGVRVDTKGQEIKDNVPYSGQDLDNERGLFFTVQLGVFAKEVSKDKFSNLAPVKTKTMPDMTVRFFSGVFHSDAEAKAKLQDAKNAGITDAFITAYYKGERITIKEAKRILAEQGPSVLSPR